MDAESKYELMNDDEKDTIINASFEKFKKFAKDQYNVQELHEIVKEFFKYNANITADSRLKTPKEFCSDLKLSYRKPIDHEKLLYPEYFSVMIFKSQSKNILRESELAICIKGPKKRSDHHY
eukprot:XP_016657007.1 PREDICTED: uncharacterized protein LOC107882715 [Acyrthosiphon pisum]